MGEADSVITILPSTMWFNSNAQPDDVLRYHLLQNFFLPIAFMLDAVG